MFHPSKMLFVINSDQIIITKVGTYYAGKKKENAVLGDIHDPVELDTFHSFLDFDRSSSGGKWMTLPDFYINFLSDGAVIGYLGVLGRGIFRHGSWDSDYSLKSDKTDEFIEWLVRNHVRTIYT